MRGILTAALFLATLVLGTGARPSAQSAPPANAERIARESARLDAWFEARFEERLAFSPMQQTMLGRKTGYDRIDDLSEAGLDAQREWSRQTVADLRAEFDYALLSPEAKTSYDLWIYQHQQAEAGRPFRRRGYLFHQMGGQHTGLPQFLINFHRVEDEADMRAYVARLGEVARALGQALDRAKLAAAEGVHAPRFAYDAVIDQARAVITGAPFAGPGDAPLWADAAAKIAALEAGGAIDAARAEALRQAARAALTERVQPAYAALVAWAEAEIPQAPEVATGVWILPEGAAFYEERLAAQTTTDMTAAQIHELGLQEVARIKAEMDAIRKQVGFAGTLPEFFTFVREDPQFYLPNTDEGREAYLETARQHMSFIEEKLPDYFGLLPKADLVVRRVEAFREVPGQAQHYVRGAPDGSRPGIYYSHLSDMGAMPRPQMEVIAYHEGLPGHHLQISIAQERDAVPTFRRQAGFTAFTEGWGLYAERLAKEMGAYADPYADFGRLTTEIWRAIRLVVDTGLHAMQWTEEDAVAYFTANSPAADGQIRAEVRRYIVMPGQATTYKIGMIRILDLRARAAAALGDRFDLREFHDTVLGGGALPLAMLERRVEDWIAARQAR